MDIETERNCFKLIRLALDRIDSDEDVRRDANTSPGLFLSTILMVGAAYLPIEQKKEMMKVLNEFGADFSTTMFEDLLDLKEFLCPENHENRR